MRPHLSSVAQVAHPWRETLGSFQGTTFSKLRKFPNTFFAIFIVNILQNSLNLQVSSSFVTKFQMFSKFSRTFGQTFPLRTYSLLPGFIDYFPNKNCSEFDNAPRFLEAFPLFSYIRFDHQLKIGIRTPVATLNSTLTVFLKLINQQQHNIIHNRFDNNTVRYRQMFARRGVLLMVDTW